MKQKRLVTFGKTCAAILAVLTFGLGQGQAQLTGKKTTSQPGVGSAAATGTSAAAGSVPTSGPSTIRHGDFQDAVIINTGTIDGIKLDYSDLREAEIWGRAIIHSDGSYTETKVSDDGQTITQKTKSGNGVLLQERVIMADGRGKPSQVMIKDASGQFRYRGVLLYDVAGRFTEELLYDMQNQLLRRRIQEYGAGKPKLRVFDYAKHIPADLQLVITKEIDPAEARKNEREFQRLAKERDKAEERAQEPEKKKKGLFGIFRKSD